MQKTSFFDLMFSKNIKSKKTSNQTKRFWSLHKTSNQNIRHQIKHQTKELRNIKHQTKVIRSLRETSNQKQTSTSNQGKFSGIPVQFYFFSNPLEFKKKGIGSVTRQKIKVGSVAFVL